MRHLHNNRQGYDDDLDLWFGFDNDEQAAAWLAEPQPAPDYGTAPSEQIHTIQVAPAFNAYTIGVTCPAAATVGPIVQLLQADEGRMRAVINSILPTGSYLLIGTRESCLGGQGFPVQQGLSVELKNTRAVWAVLSLGSAAGPITGTVGVLTESLVG